mmetsp:Transcript_17968/g.31626  ORF Transcript_17968/g.31626 Transcript_17968/m.31626 type:complete len:428 (-) Transcript_17968:269-1552(-)
MNMSMPMPSESELFPNCVQIYDQMRVFDDSNDDLFAPIPIGRGSGTGSPSSPGPTGVPATIDGSDGTNNCSAEDSSKSFPLVLHTIVSEEDSDCIHWCPCGTRFVIADKDVFSRNILPYHFGGRGGATTKFTSFTRRLKRWNFQRVPSGREMGAYFHEKFRRGELDLVKTITYPVSKSPPLSRAKGSGQPAVPKARRRASTGNICMPGPTATGPMEFDDAVLDISPTPIKGPIKATQDGSIPPLPFLDGDMKNWLSSADFMEDEGSSMNNTPSFDAMPASVISNSSFLLPPPAFPNNVMSGGSHVEAGGMMNPMSMRPGAMRRHSHALTSSPPSMYMPMMATSSNVTNSFTPSQLLGVNSSCYPEVAMSANNNMSFASNNNVSTTVKQNTLPQPQHIGSSADDGSKDPFNLSREFSFGDLKMIDPFT